MNPAYVAAEYFIEALRKNPTFCINYHCINLLLQEAPKEVKSYFRNEQQNDPLHIFKKFPDVFVLDGSGITLTDAFLSLYAFPLSAEFCSDKASSDVFETAAIEYFKLILIRCGRLHYFNLFSVLLNQKGLWLAEFYLHFSEPDMLKFFLKHSDIFTVSKDTVFLNIYSSPILKEIEPSEGEKSLRKVSQATYFLLSCFSSLHYLELKQCISFVLCSVRDYLNSFSLIQQRSLFESLPETTMDNAGSLSLKNAASTPSHPKSRKVRLISVIVCILAFERQMHFQKIADEVSRRVSSTVHSVLCSLSVSEQFHFFKDFSDYFVISTDGHVQLLPCFVFPLCTFESNVSYPQTCDGKFQLTNPNAPGVKTNLPDINYNTEISYAGVNSWNSNKSIPGQNMKFCNNVTLKISDFSTNYNLSNFSGNLSIVDNQLAQLLAIHTISVRMKVAVIFLWTCFLSPSHENVLGCCLYVLNDVFKSFQALTFNGKQIFIQEYCNFFDKVSQAGITTVPSLNCICDQEKVLLFIVYALSQENKIHFETLLSLINYCNVDMEFNLWSNRLVYFQQLSNYVTVSPDGFVRLSKTFETVQLLVWPFFHASPNSSLSESKEVQVSEIETPPSHDGWFEECDEIVSIAGSNLTLPTDIGTKDKSALPSRISYKLQLSLLHLNNLFDRLVAVHFLETFLHALSDVKSYFLSLSSSKRQRFVESFFKDINENSVFEINLKPSEMSANSLSDKEIALLTITYLLTEVKSAHYVNIVKKLRSIGIKYTLCEIKAKSQFKHFKSLEGYFVIDGAGFVCLSSSFTSISSTVNSLSAFSHESQGKLKIIKVKLNDGSPQKAEESKDIKPVCDSSSTKCPSSLDSVLNLSELIIDLSVSKLSFCEKMKLEILCKHFNCSDVKPVQHYFSYQTVAEVKKFFADIPEYFEVSKDDFICLRKGVISSYVPKTSLVVKDPKGRFVLNASSDLINYSGPDFVLSGCSSKGITASSSSVISKKCGKSKNKISNDEQPVNSKKSSKLSAKELIKTAQVVSKVKKNAPKIKAAVSNDDKKSIQLWQDLVSEKKPSVTPPSPEQLTQTGSTSHEAQCNSRTISMSSIPERMTVTIQMPCQPCINSASQQSCASSKIKDLSSDNPATASNLSEKSATGLAKSEIPRKLHTNSASQQSCASSKIKDLSSDNPATASNLSEKLATGLAKSEMPRKPYSKSASQQPCASSKVKDLSSDNPVTASNLSKKLATSLANSEMPRQPYEKGANLADGRLTSKNKEVSSSNSLTACDRANILASSLPEPENYSAQISSRDLDHLMSYGLELVSAFLDEDSVCSSSLDKCDDVTFMTKHTDQPAISASSSNNINSVVPGGECSFSSLSAEFKAINFFSTILGNYDSGVSASFLGKHLNLASLEVKTFMRDFYRENFVSFFSRHERMFYVLPETENICLVRAK